MSNNARGFGWLPDRTKGPEEKPDLNALLLSPSSEYPEAHSQRRFILSVLDQGWIGSCVANAITQAVRSAHARDGIVAPALASRLYLYYMLRTYIGTEKWDSGGQNRDGFRALSKYGYLPESAYPYRTTKYAEAPPPTVFRKAFDQSVKRGEPVTLRYYRIFETGEDRVRMIRSLMARDMFIVFGTSVSKEFADYDQGDRVWDTPSPGSVAGGHAMMLSDYYADGHFASVGSWGADAHDHGYHHFTPDYIASDVTRDLWAVASPPRYSEAA